MEMDRSQSALVQAQDNRLDMGKYRRDMPMVAEAREVVVPPRQGLEAAQQVQAWALVPVAGLMGVKIHFRPTHVRNPQLKEGPNPRVLLSLPTPARSY